MDITPILNVLQVLSGLLIIALVLLQRQDTGFIPPQRILIEHEED